MPIYEEEGRVTREDLEALGKRNRCLVCHGRLDVFLDADQHLAYLACTDYLRTKHEGIERPPSRYEKEGLATLNIPTRREIVERDYGGEKTKALDKYMGGGIVMTRSVATEIVETLWGDAPIIEKTKCILLCQTYQLNPLMKHLYLIGYKRNDRSGKPVLDREGKQVYDWSIQQGIGATRLLAQRKHHFSYLDMTPRLATQAEIEKILGFTADKNCVYGFCHIKDTDTGAEAFGLRGIPKNENTKGMEKGNTHLNMACVRAERLALDRQYPGEMPAGLEVVDERYLEVADIGKVNTTTGEIVEGEVKEIAEAKPEDKKSPDLPPDVAPTPPIDKTSEFGICPIHHIALVAGAKAGFPPFCPTRVPGRSRSEGKEVWCKGKLPENGAVEKPLIAEQPAQSEKTPISEFFSWLLSHGKERTPSWFYANFSYTEEELKNPLKFEAAYAEVRSVTDWED